MVTTVKFAPPRPVLYCEICGMEITRKHGRGWQSRLKDKHHFCCNEHKVEYYKKNRKDFKPFYSHKANEWIDKIYKKRGVELKNDK